MLTGFAAINEEAALVVVTSPESASANACLLTAGAPLKPGKFSGVSNSGTVSLCPTFAIFLGFNGLLVASIPLVNLLASTLGTGSEPNLSSILLPGAKLTKPPSCTNPLSFGAGANTLFSVTTGGALGPAISSLVAGLPVNLVPIFLADFNTSSEDIPFNFPFINAAIFGLKCADSIAAIIPLSPLIVFWKFIPCSNSCLVASLCFGAFCK